MINSGVWRRFALAVVALVAAMISPAAVHNIPLWEAGKVPLATG